MKYIFIHHSADRSVKPQVEKIISYHMQKFGQSGSYHRFIEKNGTVNVLHDDDFVCYHSGNWFYNTNSVAVCLAGDFRFEEPSEQQLEALFHVVSDWQMTYGIPDANVLYHRDVRSTACPGIYDFKGWLQQRRKMELERRLDTAFKAIPRASESRKLLLARLIERIQKILRSW